MPRPRLSAVERQRNRQRRLADQRERSRRNRAIAAAQAPVTGEANATQHADDRQRSPEEEAVLSPSRDVEQHTHVCDARFAQQRRETTGNVCFIDCLHMVVIISQCQSVVERPRNQQQRLENARERSRRNRAHQTAEQVVARREADARQHREHRQRLTEQEAASIRLSNADQHRGAHATRTAAQRRETTGIARSIDRRPTTAHHLGAMNHTCAACGAAHFFDEKTTRNQTVYSTCCASGKVQLQMFHDFPTTLQDLYTGDGDDAKNFRQNIRNYNNGLAMASMVANIEAPPGHGPYCFRVHGQVYHMLGGLRPRIPNLPQCAQVLIMDTNAAAEELAGRPMNRNCDERIFANLHEILQISNPFVQAFKLMDAVAKEETARALAEGCPSRPVRMIFDETTGDDPRRYNAATANEVAVVYVGSESEIPGDHYLIVHEQTGALKRISHLDKRCDPLTYPLLFPKGEFGWHPAIERRNPTSERRVRVTQKEFYGYLLFPRTGLFNPLHYACKLLQQIIVDWWLKIEMNRLYFIRQNQSELRLDTVRNLQDFMLGDPTDAGPPGRRIILAATFIGGPRYMIGQYQDAMSIVSKYGKPDLFITFTCNPTWPEITSNLAPGQTASDRPDLVARVFQLKVKAFHDYVVKQQVLGDVAAYIYVIEFQKRGLPHMHMLITLKSGSKLTSAAEVDSLISAELPDPVTEPALHRIVSTSMIHRPCGLFNPESPCMRNARCTKRFPKAFKEDTSLLVDGYPEYRRRNDGRTVLCRGIPLDNRSVVPYCPFLTLLFEAHINVEVCALIHAVKYLFKYVYKGPDRAKIRLHQETSDNAQHHDEIDSYWDTRYVCAPEAAHRIFGFPLSARSDTVTRLQVHLPGFENVPFQTGEEAAALQAAATRFSTLTAFFDRNRRCRDLEAEHGCLPDGVIDSRNLRYTEMPEQFIFDKTWRQRQRSGDKAIGRMYFVSPQDSERFALRLLLLYGTGFTSFDDVRTVNGILYESFVDAARAAGYLQNDAYFRDALREAAALRMPIQLRSFFVTLIAFADLQPPCPQQLWTEFREDFMEDFLHQGMSQAMAESRAFHEITQRLTDLHRDPAILLPLDIPRLNMETPQVDLEMHRATGTAMYQQLNHEQQPIVDTILHALENPQGQCFFIDGPGGCGKTFVYNTLFHLAISRGKTVVNVAWTGIAANLLPEGRTVTSTFKLVVQDDSRSSTMRRQTKEAADLRATDVFVWDEAPMAPRTALETVDSLLQDLMQSNTPFGGKIMILGGDFRQILPVVERGTRSQIIDACIKRSNLWPQFRQFRLHGNMRLAGNDAEFQGWLLRLGNGEVGPSLDVPPDMACNGELADVIFDDVLDPESGVDLAECAILTPKNVDASRTNEVVLNKLPGPVTLFRSQDDAIVEDPNDAFNFPTEFLNQMTPATLPPHELRLKTGCIVMLLRNIDVRHGLCNGTRLIVTSIFHRTVVCTFAAGPNKGVPVLIPRIDCYYEHRSLPFRLRRRQFPLKLSFCMTINKSQGQSFTRVGIDLTDPVFAHGQLYVALSRARSRSQIYISAPNRSTTNVVYPEVL